MKKNMSASEIIKVTLNEKAGNDKAKADLLRNDMKGYVGPDFAKVASDSDLLAMSDLQDKRAAVFNAKVRPINDKIDLLRKKYKLK